MAKRLNISNNNENMVGDLTTTLTPQVTKGVKEKSQKQRTSLVMGVEDYDYIKDRRRVWSFERGQDLTIEDVLSEIIQFHQKNAK